jgi:hypothetical protein
MDAVLPAREGSWHVLHKRPVKILLFKPWGICPSQLLLWREILAWEDSWLVCLKKKRLGGFVISVPDGGYLLKIGLLEVPCIAGDSFSVWS